MINKPLIIITILILILGIVYLIPVNLPITNLTPDVCDETVFNAILLPETSVYKIKSKGQIVKIGVTPKFYVHCKFIKKIIIDEQYVFFLVKAENNELLLVSENSFIDLKDKEEVKPIVPEMELKQ